MVQAEDLKVYQATVRMSQALDFVLSSSATADDALCRATPRSAPDKLQSLAQAILPCLRLETGEDPRKLELAVIPPQEKVRGRGHGMPRPPPKALSF